MAARIVALAACVIAACTLLAGCGQRGPLVLPDDTLETEPQNGNETQDDEQEEE